MGFRAWFQRIFSPRPAHAEVRRPAGWGDFFSPEEYRRFIRLVEAELRQQGFRFTINGGTVVVTGDHADNQRQMGLLNLAQMCKSRPKHDWPEIIAHHFGQLERIDRERRALAERTRDFDRVAELLAVRIWPRDYLEGIGFDAAVHREDLEGTVSVLVYDLPTSIQNVSPKDAEAWGKAPDELFALGLANVRENYTPDILRQDVGDGVEIVLFADESFFIASFALLLDHYPEYVGAHGSLISIPHRHVLLCYPIESLDVIRAINLLIQITAGMEKEGPGSISPHLYWYRDGEFTRLPYRLTGRELRFFPPESFVAMLNDLSEAGEDE